MVLMLREMEYEIIEEDECKEYENLKYLKELCMYYESYMKVLWILMSYVCIMNRNINS